MYDAPYLKLRRKIHAPPDHDYYCSQRKEAHPDEKIDNWLNCPLHLREAVGAFRLPEQHKNKKREERHRPIHVEKIDPVGSWQLSCVISVCSEYRNQIGIHLICLLHRGSPRVQAKGCPGK